MDKAAAERLMAIYRRAGAVLGEADPILRALPEPERGVRLRALAEIYLALWETLERPIVRDYPGLDPDLAYAGATPADLGQVEDLYAAAGYRGGIAPADTVLVAKTAGAVVAAVRLCREEGAVVLRGMQVAPAWQRQGVGARLLAACRPGLAQGPAFCLPYRHLAGFYAAAGFEAVDAADLPDFLARRLASYLADGQDVIAMRRRPGRAGPDPAADPSG